MHGSIGGIEYWLPEQVVTNQDLKAEYPEWDTDKIGDKTGIYQRHIARPDECASDLGFNAAKQLFASGKCSPGEIDFLILCTQSPDYLLPTTACVLQDRLEIPTTAGAFDMNLGCSGFVYGLGCAHGLIESGQANNVLLITAETYSKFIHPGDKSVRTLFGDAGAATLIRGSDEGPSKMGPFVYGTDGRGASNLMVEAGGMRHRSEAASREETRDASGNIRSAGNLYMNGAEIFTFTLRAVPHCVETLMAKSQMKMEDIDLFVFHQANRYMLTHLRNRMAIPEEKFLLAPSDCGNTVSSSIPIALKQASESGQLKHGDLVMLVGFGVGYSWGATLLRW